VELSAKFKRSSQAMDYLGSGPQSKSGRRQFFHRRERRKH